MNGITITCNLLVAIGDRLLQSLRFMITLERKVATCFRQITSLHTVFAIVIHAVCSNSLLSDYIEVVQ